MLGFGLLMHTAPAGMQGTENMNCASQGHVVCLVCQQRMCSAPESTRCWCTEQEHRRRSTAGDCLLVSAQEGWKDQDNWGSICYMPPQNPTSTQICKALCSQLSSWQQLSCLTLTAVPGVMCMISSHLIQSLSEIPPMGTVGGKRREPVNSFRLSQLRKKKYF